MTNSVVEGVDYVSASGTCYVISLTTQLVCSIRYSGMDTGE